MKTYDTHKINLKDILENNDPIHPAWQQIMSTSKYKEFEKEIAKIINHGKNDDLGNT